MSPAPRGKAVHRRSAWLFNVCYLKDANILLITKIESQLSGQIYPPLEQVEWEDSLTTVSQGLAARRGKIYRKGTKMYPNLDRYHGEFIQGRREGLGLLTYANGDTYDGEWINNLFHGHGVFSSVDFMNVAPGIPHTGQ